MHRTITTAIAIAQYLILAVCLAHVVGVEAATAPTATEFPRLDPPASGDYRKPNEAFIIRLAAPNNPAVSRLALELDNIDVTRRIAPVDDSYTVFRLQPHKPLGRGAHILRLVQYRADGAIVELARWTVQVRAVATKITPTLNIGLSGRIDEQPNTDATYRLAVQGSSRIEAYTDNGERRWSAVGDFLGNSSNPNGAGTQYQPLDMGGFLITRDSEHTNLSVGHHFPGAIQGVANGNLIVDGQLRRGVSGTLRAGPWDGAVTAFALRSESIHGFEHGFGVGDGDNRIAGGMLRMQPLANVAVGLGYVSGASNAVGFGTGAAFTGLSGNAVNLVVDSAWFDHRLGLRAEAAHSSVDLGGGFGELSDQAYAVNLTFRPKKGLQLGEHLLRWDFSLGYVDLGAGFRSIGNLGQIANLREYRVGLNVSTDTVSLNFTGSRAQDNVDSALYPSTRADTVNAVFGWQPKVSDDFGGWLFGQPYLSLSLLGDHRETVRMPAGSAAFPVDLTTRGYLLGARFAHPLGYWAVSGGTTTVDDATNLYPDMRYDSLTLDAGFQINKRYNLAPGLSYAVATDRATGVRTRTTGVHVSQYWAIVPERLDLQLGVSLNHIEASDDSQDTEQLAGNLRLSWYLQPFTLWLAGSYNEVDSRMLYSFAGMPLVYKQDDEAYQVLVGISYSFGGISFP